MWGRRKHVFNGRLSTMVLSTARDGRITLQVVTEREDLINLELCEADAENMGWALLSIVQKSKTAQ